MSDGRITEESLNETPSPVVEQPKEEVAKVEATQPDPEPQATTPVQENQEVALDDKLARLEELSREIDQKMASLNKQSETFFQSKATAVDTQRHVDKAANMKANLAKQPKVTVMVPLVGGEKKGTFLPVTLNGYRLNVPKGVYTEVPQQVAEIIRESQNQTLAAEQDNPYNLDNAPEYKKQALEG